MIDKEATFEWLLKCEIWQHIVIISELIAHGECLESVVY